MNNHKVTDFSKLRDEITISAGEHSKYGGWDGIVYNSTTIVTIIMTSLAALLDVDVFYLKIISGIAAILIAIDRVLNWGARWVYHRQMRHEYLIILAKISFYENMPENFSDEEKKKYYEEIYTELYNIRRKEILMPGVN